MAECSKCGKSVSKDIKFCPECGMKIKIVEKNIPKSEVNILKFSLVNAVTGIIIGFIFLCFTLYTYSANAQYNPDLYSAFPAYKYILYPLGFFVGAFLTSGLCLWLYSRTEKEKQITKLKLPKMGILFAITGTIVGFGINLILFLNYLPTAVREGFDTSFFGVVPALLLISLRYAFGFLLFALISTWIYNTWFSNKNEK